MKLLKKYLKDERIDLEDGEVKLTMIPVTTSQQARLMDMGSVSGTNARIELTRWCLKNCIDQIEVSGVVLDPMQLADGADLSDTDTLLVMLKIGKMIITEVLLKAEDVKKSLPQPEPGA